MIVLSGNVDAVAGFVSGASSKKTAVRNSDVSFNDVLGKAQDAVKNEKKQDYAANETTKKSSQINNQDKSYKRSIKSENSEQFEGNDNIQNKDTKSEREIEALAQMLGINVEDLQKLLNYCNITLDEIQNCTDANQLAEKIGLVLDLTESQTYALADILSKSIAKSEVQVLEGTQIDTETTANQIGEVSTVEGAEHEEASAEGMKVIVETVRSALNQNINEAKPESDGMTVLQTGLSEVHGEENSIESLPEGNPEQGTDAVKAQTKVYDETEQDLEKRFSEEDMENKGLEIDSRDFEKEDTKFASDQENDNFQANMANYVNNVNTTTTVQTGNVAMSERPNFTDAQITREELLNQIIDKAKVLIDGYKSEMVINLKPDYLGKLELKIVTERGIMVANFTAESYQVKEVLESNMQTLKDLLEKQGYVISDMNVSVGGGETNRKEEPQNWKPSYTNSQVRKINDPSLSNVSSGYVLQNSKAISNYQWNDSSINYTA